MGDRGKKRRIEEDGEEEGAGASESDEAEEQDVDASEDEEGEEGEDYNEAYMAGFAPVVIKDDRANSKDGWSLVGKRDAEPFMQWLIAPFPLDKFVESVWEKRPLVVKREDSHPDYYKGWFSTEEVQRLLRDEGMKYKYNVDVTSYKGKRETWNYNKDGTSEIADSEAVWERYHKEGCSIRMLHPQRKMLSAMERYWNCAVGCNTYLTPPNSQGFSPHWDDIEAIVLQLEGRKKWKLYKPRTPEEALPRYSSPNFEQDEIGEPILEVELGPGDLLYLPRGCIHQAESPPGHHSLHVTLSTNQFNTWADLLEVAVPRALQLAASEHCKLRTAPPREFMQYMGVVHSDKDSPEREDFHAQIMGMVGMIFSNFPVDAVADQMAKKLIQQRLPPPPLDDTFLSGSSGANEISPKSKVRLAYPSCARLVIEDDFAMIYHIMDNPRRMHMEGENEDDSGDEAYAAEEEQDNVEQRGALKFNLDEASALEQLVTMEDCETFKVGDLPLDSKKECVALVQRLVTAKVLSVA